jgi:superfamily II DNA or RNA helicase
VAEKPTLHLHLGSYDADPLLAALTDHPAVFAGKDRSPLEISTGIRLVLADARLVGGEIALIPDQEAARCLQIGPDFWIASENSLARCGTGPAPAPLAGILKSLARGETTTVPLPALLENLDPWQQWLAFPNGTWIDSLHFLPATADFHLTLDGSLQHLEARLAVAYGSAGPVPPGLGKVPHLPRLVGDHCEVRNFAAEQQAVRRLECAGFQSTDLATGSWALKGESAVLDFLARSLPEFQSDWFVTEGPRFGQTRRQVAVVSPTIEILGSGEDWLGFDLKFQTDDGITVPHEEIRRLIRSGKRNSAKSGGKRLILCDSVADLIEPLFSELELRQESGHFKASARAGEVIMEIRNKLRKSLTASHPPQLPTFHSPPTLQAKLRPYQCQGTAWLLDRANRFGGALLADDMGLGKTLQTIALIEHLFFNPTSPPGPVLVVATTSLLGNWRAEFARFAPSRRVRILHGSGRDDERERVSSGDVALTSYGTLARDLAWHLKQPYRAVVVDEASLMRNPDTDHAKAVAKLHAACRIALTGTPVENSVRDLWSVFRFIQPGWLGSRQEFRERYEAPLAAGESAAAVMERLRLKTSPFLLRRTKEEVAPDLPTKLIIDEFCDLSPDQQTVYRELLVEGRKRVESIADSGNPGAARMQMLTALLRLRQTCCDLALLGSDNFNRLLVARRSAKLQRLLELLEEALNGGHRVLIFSQFQKQLLEIERSIAERGWDCLRLDGQTRDRQQLVDKFQSPDGPPVFLISLKAGGYGLNLTAADIVIHFDPWWNPAAEAQATDRTHRIGQTRPVTVYRLLTRGTVEEKVVRLQQRKRELAAAIDESGTNDARGWSDAELGALFG